MEQNKDRCFFYTWLVRWLPKMIQKLAFAVTYSHFDQRFLKVFLTNMHPSLDKTLYILYQPHIITNSHAYLLLFCDIIHHLSSMTFDYTYGTHFNSHSHFGTLNFLNAARSCTPVYQEPSAAADS